MINLHTIIKFVYCIVYISCIIKQLPERFNNEISGGGFTSAVSAVSRNARALQLMTINCIRLCPLCNRYKMEENYNCINFWKLQTFRPAEFCTKQILNMLILNVPFSIHVINHSRPSSFSQFCYAVLWIRNDFFWIRIQL